MHIDQHHFPPELSTKEAEKRAVMQQTSCGILVLYNTTEKGLSAIPSLYSSAGFLYFIFPCFSHCFITFLTVIDISPSFL